ncbi:hypothetical protein ACTFIW_005417 [Dictyostelium discoideum]
MKRLRNSYSILLKIVIISTCLLLLINIALIYEDPNLINSNCKTTTTKITKAQNNNKGLENLNKSKKKLLLILDYKLFNEDTYMKSFSECTSIPNQSQCGFTTDISLANESDGILYFIPRTTKKNYNRSYTSVHRTSEKQLFFGWSMESPSMYPLENDDTHLSLNYNVTIGYPLNDYQKYGAGVSEEEYEEKDIQSSHIYTPYGPVPFKGSDHYSYLFKFGKLKEIPKKRDYNIMWMAGNCRNQKLGRTKLVKQMMRFTTIDSYGKCLHNKDLKMNYGPNVLLRSLQKLKILRKYDFIVAIENSRCEDYVTEKLWEPLSVGTIPIYLGATNIDEFLPHPDAIINIANFNSINHLMKYVRDVGLNETLREKHLAWIKKPLPKRFKNLLNQSLNNQNLFCSICKKLVNLDNNDNINYTPLSKPFKQCIEGKFTLPIYTEEEKERGRLLRLQKQQEQEKLELQNSNDNYNNDNEEEEEEEEEYNDSGNDSGYDSGNDSGYDSGNNDSNSI